MNRLGRLKLLDKLFLGREELNRNQSFIYDRIKFLLKINGYGIASKDDFIVRSGTLPGTIRIEESLAIDNFGNIIYKEAEDNIPIPNNKSYWLIIQHNKTSIEKGVLSISERGVVTGEGTQFNSLLRGLLSYKQVRIKFHKNDSSLLRNDQEYTVSEVVNDTNIVLSGSFIKESNLRYSIIGTFDRDLIPSDGTIYDIDGCQLERIEGVSNTYPSNANIDNKERFAIAYVSNVEGDIFVQDKRIQFYANLSELIQPKEWEVIQELEEGVFNDKVNPLSIRMHSDNYTFQIKGSFKTNKKSGKLFKLPPNYTLELPSVIEVIDGSNKIFHLHLNEEGVVSVLNSSNGPSGDTTVLNNIVSKLITIK